MKKSLLLSSVTLAAAALLFMASSRSQHAKPELPIMQAFSATPRFEDKQQIFDRTIDLTRWDMHERYERELTNFCYTHNSTLLTLKRANRLFPIIVPILKEEGVPADFIYLCCIESSMNQRALSPAKAAGLWQFMPETGRQYGLTINDEVDERYHTVKATHAACRYLKDAYKKFGDWMAVAASYNGGMGGIQRKLSAQQVTDAMDLFLPEETSRYMFRIMAMKEIFRDPYRYGFVLYADQLYRPIRTRQVHVTSAVADLAAFAKQHGTTYFQIKEFNPWLRDSKISARKGLSINYQIDIPLEEDMNYNQPFPVYNTDWVVDE